MAAHSLIFAEPRWFWALPIIALGTVLLRVVASHIARRRLSRFLAVRWIADAAPSSSRRLSGFLLPALALGAFAVALARPLTGPKSANADRSGVDLVIALDVSKSMWVQDVPPTRLEAVKQSLKDWLSKQQGDRIGLVVFAGDAFVQAPLTFDYAALELVLAEAGPASVSRGGTNIPKAVEIATKMLNRNDRGGRALILVSDGENLESDAISAARKAHAEEGIFIYTVGVGTTAGGKVPASDPTQPAKPGRTGIRSEYGAEVISRMDRHTLGQIAAAGGGRYYDFESGQPIFQTLRDQSLIPLTRKTHRVDTRDYNEWFQVPLALGILLIALEPVVGRNRDRSAKGKTGVPVIQPATLSRPRAAKILTLFLLLGCGGMAGASEEAERLFKDGRQEEAVELLRREMEEGPGEPWRRYNLALGLYRCGRYEEAVAIFEGLTTDKTLGNDALLQIANSRARLAAQLKTTGNMAGIVLALEQALSAYDTLVEIRPGKVAIHNRGVTSQELEKFLLEIGASRTLAGGENPLRQAVQAYERAAELNPGHEPLASNARRLLAEELARQGGRIAAEADKAEAKGASLKEILAQRHAAVAKLEEAAALAPANQSLQEEIRQQREKMSGALTKAAEEQTRPLLPKDQLEHRDHLSMEDALGKLEEAVSLDEKNTSAPELKKQLEEKLVNSYNATGNKLLDEIKEGRLKAAGRLFAAKKAAEAFTNTLAHDAENISAKEGLAKAEELLPELNSIVGRETMEKAASLAEGPEGVEAPAKDLKTAAAMLEQAEQNFSAAVAMRPDNADYKQGQDEVRALLEKTRNRLDKQLAATTPAAEPGKEPGESTSPAKGEAEFQSMNALRGKGGGIKSTDGKFWENKIRDW